MENKKKNQGPVDAIKGAVQKIVEKVGLDDKDLLKTAGNAVLKAQEVLSRADDAVRDTA